VPRSSTLYIPILVALSSLVLGCAEQVDGGPILLTFDPCQPVDVVPDPAATPAQRQAIAGGIALWNDLAATRLRLMGGVDGTEAPAAGAPVIPLHYQGAAAAFHGFYDDKRGEIFINLGLVDHPREITIAHEIGHAFGLLHVSTDERPSVMNTGNLVIAPTAGDADALAARWGRCTQDDPGR
jgi:hypothetical protein